MIIIMSGGTVSVPKRTFSLRTFRVNRVIIWTASRLIYALYKPNIHTEEV